MGHYFLDIQYIKVGEKKDFLKEMREEADIDKSGTIEFAEFIIMMAR